MKLNSKKRDFIIALTAFVILFLLNFISKTFFSSFNETKTHIIIGLILGLIAVLFSLKIIFSIFWTKTKK
uniref:hypothetical protein n=1 Tax=Bacillus multifaciens TaxID=3068506 RepID=UPI003F49A502